MSWASRKPSASAGDFVSSPPITSTRPRTGDGCWARPASASATKRSYETPTGSSSQRRRDDRAGSIELELASFCDELAGEGNGLCRLLGRECLGRDGPRQAIRIACRNIVLIELACRVSEVGKIRPS